MSNADKPRKPYAAPTVTKLEESDPRVRAALRLETLQGQYDAAKAFLVESETRGAELRKSVRAVVLELRQGTIGRGELADMLAAALLPPETSPAPSTPVEGAGPR
jgi:hypothetical protein